MEYFTSFSKTSQKPPHRCRSSSVGRSIVPLVLLCRSARYYFRAAKNVRTASPWWRYTQISKQTKRETSEGRKTALTFYCLKFDEGGSKFRPSKTDVPSWTRTRVPRWRYLRIVHCIKYGARKALGHGSSSRFLCLPP